MQEKHAVADWNSIINVIKMVVFDDAVDFEEVKARVAKKSELGMGFIPSKKARLTQKDCGLDSTLVFEINPNDRAKISALHSLLTLKDPRGMRWLSMYQ
jgi:hypothetical protein